MQLSYDWIVSDDTWFALMCARWHLNVDYSTDLGVRRYSEACSLGIVFG